MTSFIGTAGAALRSGEAVYQGADGLIYPLRPKGWFARFLAKAKLELLFLRQRVPAGVLLSAALKGEKAEVITSVPEIRGNFLDFKFLGGPPLAAKPGVRRLLPKTYGGLNVYEVQLVGGPCHGGKSICSHDTTYCGRELYVRGGDDRYYWQPAAGGKN